MNTQEVKVIDVRTPGEFAGGHVEGSINIPVNIIHEHIEEIKAINQPIILCCASGGRSNSAYHFLKSNGIENISDGGPWFQVVEALKN